MSLDQHPRLQEALDYGYEFNIGKYINNGFDLFKQNIGGFVAYTFVYFAIMLVAGIIPFLGNIASIVIGPPLAAGFYLVANKIHRQQTSEFNDFFKGFDFIGPLIMVSIVSTVIYIVAMIPFFASAWAFLDFFSDPYGSYEYGLESNFPFWSLLLLAPIMYLGVAWRWAPMFVIFHKFSFWDAMETSRRLITKKWFNHFGFILLFGLFAIGGMLALVIGLIFVMPMIVCMDYAAFADVTKLMESESSADDIVAHLVE